MKNEHQRQQTDEPTKTNEKLPITIKPYWYIDPSIVYRAMTSPVRSHTLNFHSRKSQISFKLWDIRIFLNPSKQINPSDHSASFVLASLLFVVCLFFFLYCIMTDRLCCRCCCSRKRIKIKTVSGWFHSIVFHPNPFSYCFFLPSNVFGARLYRKVKFMRSIPHFWPITITIIHRMKTKS